MGREIRRVPPGWEHPKKIFFRNGIANESYRPLYDDDYESKYAQWERGLAEWRETGFAEAVKEQPEYATMGIVRAYGEYEGFLPDAEYCRPIWTPDSMTHYQMYETVSEGTPVSPVFASLSELEDYLVCQGSFGKEGPWKRENAHRFCENGHACSMIVVNGPGGTQILLPQDQ